MTAIKIAPSFLTADFGRLADEVRAVEEAGADCLHIDIMDGHFVPPIALGAVVVAAMRRATKLPLEVHLMVEAPERQVASFAEAGGDLLTIHVEATDDVATVISQIKDLGCQAGVGLSPPTPASTIDSVVADVDQILVMGVNPGWGGQSLIPETFAKLQELRQLLSRRGLTTDIELDGGVKLDNAAACATAGASVLVAGSVVFNDSAPPAQNMAALREALSAAEAKG